MANFVARGGTVTVARHSYGPKSVVGLAFWDHNSIDDATEAWWDPTTVGFDNRAGVYRYVEGGKRYAWGGWPASEAGVFDETRSTSGYERAPDQ